MGQRRVASPVTAPTDLLAADILDKCGPRRFLALPEGPDDRRHPSTVPARARAITGQRTLGLMAWR